MTKAKQRKKRLLRIQSKIDNVLASLMKLQSEGFVLNRIFSAKDGLSVLTEEYQRIMQIKTIIQYRDWLKQPSEIWYMICYSLKPEEQFKVRSALRMTCKTFYQKLLAPVSKVEWTHTHFFKELLLLRNGAPAHYLIGHGLADAHNIMALAARADRLDILQNLRHLYPIDHLALVYAIAGGSIRCLRFAHRYVSFAEVLRDKLEEISVQYGHLECLKYVHQNGTALTATARFLAVRHNRVDCLRYIHENGVAVDYQNACEAARNGHLECLIFIRDAGVKFDKNILEVSINGGLDCFRLVHETIGCFSDNTCEIAARQGKLDCLQYAHVNNAKWDANTCIAAARVGHFHCLTYAHQNGCELDFPADDRYYYNVCQRAADRGSIECLRYCHENGVPLNGFVLVSARKSNAECYAYVQKHFHENPVSDDSDDFSDSD